jgi:hypothetical protein
MQMKAQILSVIGLLLISFAAQAQDREQAMVMSLGDFSSGKLSTSYFSIYSIANMKPGKDEPDGGRNFGGYNYFSLNYKIDQDRKVSFRLPFTYQTAGYSEYGDYETERGDLQDIFVSMSFYDLGYIGAIDISGAIKLYAPTSQNSQDSGMISRLRGEFFFDWNFSRFSSLTYVLKPGMYFQGNTAYINSMAGVDDYGFYYSDPRSTTKQFELENYLELVADMNQYFALKPRLGFDEEWKYGSVANDIPATHVTKAVAGFGVEIRPARRWNMTLSVQNETILNSYKGKDIAFWQPENTSLVLLTNLFLFNL